MIPVYEAGEEDGRLYMVMRWVEGTDLHKELRADGAMPARAAMIVHQVAGALDAAHAAGLVHRDVKPANVLLSGEHAYLADFGLTRFANAKTNVTTGGHFLGTVDYMAPEQFQPGPQRRPRRRLRARLRALRRGHRQAAVHPRDRPADDARAPARPTAAGRGRLTGLRSCHHPLAGQGPEDRYPSAGDFGRAVLAASEGRSMTEAERSVARGAAAPTTRREESGPGPGAGRAAEEPRP